MRDEAIEARITPLGNACMQGDDCGISTSGPGYKVSLIKTSSPSEPAASGSENEHIVHHYYDDTTHDDHSINSYIYLWLNHD